MLLGIKTPTKNDQYSPSLPQSKKKSCHHLIHYLSILILIESLMVIWNFYLNKTNTLNNSLLIIVIIELKTPTKNDQYSPCSTQPKKYKSSPFKSPFVTNNSDKNCYDIFIYFKQSWTFFFFFYYHNSISDSSSGSKRRGHTIIEQTTHNNKCVSPHKKKIKYVRCEIYV